MRAVINLRHLEDGNVTLEDELSVEEMDVDTKDELVEVKDPLRYDLEAQRMEGGVLVQGTLALKLDCLCARCLKEFKFPLVLDHWVCHLALVGEDTAEVINDCVDLTPYIRDDIVLAFPQRPLCDPECKGLANLAEKPISEAEAAPNPWAELNKLKL